MSGTSAFLRRSCWAKSSRKIPVSTTFKIEVCEFESLIRGQDKFLSTKVSASENTFLIISLSEAVWYVGFCEATSQSTIDRGIQMLRLDINQLAQMRDPYVDQTTGRIEENNVRVLQLNVSPELAFMKQVVSIVKSIQSTVSSRGCKINKCFCFSNLSKWVVK